METSISPAAEQFSRLLQNLACTDAKSVQEVAVELIEQLKQGRIAVPVSDFNLTDDCLQVVLSSPMVGEVGSFCPIIIDQGFFYLYRYWDYQQRLLDQLTQRLTSLPKLSNRDALKASLDNYFPVDSSDVDWQKYAAASALLSHFLIISGGPGTGKTTTIAKVLKLLAQQFLLKHGSSPNIILAAPTGKAAMRMQESLRDQADEALEALISDDAMTIHRMLGYLPNHIDFKHQAHTPLFADIVVVDEASMIDLALLTKVFEAVPSHARLILLGDKDQLASVETGSVFRDLCQRLLLDVDPTCVDRVLNLMPQTFGDCMTQAIVVLRKSYRFDESSGIGQLATAIKFNHYSQAQSLLEDKHIHDVQWLNLQAFQQQFASIISTAWRLYFDLLKQNASPQALFDAFTRFRVLTALRVGSSGTESINRLIESLLQKRYIKSYSPHYHGRPVMITQNHYGLGLFNGDIGLMLKHHEGELRVWFPSTSEHWRDYPLSRLPKHETSWAMTIHKSQGSEFDEVLMVLPEIDSPVLSQELIYTGVTRAKKKLSIASPMEIFRLGLQRQQQRSTGL